jgi:hypothetical protein
MTTTNTPAASDAELRADALEDLKQTFHFLRAMHGLSFPKALSALTTLESSTQPAAVPAVVTAVDSTPVKD